MSTPLELDPRWEWHHTRAIGGRERWIRGQCRHTEVVPVESGGEVVARLCLVCDGQLPAAEPPAWTWMRTESIR